MTGRLSRAFLTLALCFLCAMSSAFSVPSVAQTKSLQEGIDLLQAGKQWEALQVLAQAKAAAPEDDRPYYYSGVALVQLGRLREAAAELGRAVELSPDSPRNALLHAEVLSRLGHVSAAVQTLAPYEDANRLQTLDAPSLWALSDLYFRLDRLDSALSPLEVLRPQQPENPNLLLRMGEILLSLGRFDEAEEAFDAVLKTSPGSPEAHFGLGVAAWRGRALEKARQHLQQAYRQQPGNARYAYHLGAVLLDLGDLEQAKKMLEESESAAGEILEIYTALARVHRRLGNLEASRRYLERFRAARENAQEAREVERQAERLLAQATAELQAGRVTPARDLLDQVIAVDSSNATAHAYLAKIYLSSRHWHDARVHLEALRSIRGDEFEVHYLWAEFYYQQKMPDPALQHALAASRLQPADGEVHNLLGNIYMSLGRYAEAVEAYQVAVSSSPSRPEFRTNLEAAQRRLPPQG